ncbi:type I-G CRISPR-associated RAMP protein Csb1/Cas7g [Plasticicumulans acidivorans]|uniref:CRISPR-associated protein Csb1 n=1 Tax=Plasticicumulans acidivorans TaxID=886464 RepID=A0A317MVJ0_9GAMM|nr:type I-U CRISPR-associated RAMP protein Csb1/Cas7u [Plasticicumulans acidivorans]PWV62286.1 CRISPR-associated protein Csb1 [Plasticicumulans acidivorans]
MDTGLAVLTLDQLQTAVAQAAAIRLRQALAPAGGPGSKVFPPTHEGGQYAWETRRVEGAEVRCVLLDSVQSQANRCELALLDALREGRLTLPLIEADFAEFPDLGTVSTLEAPHRIADAIFRDSTLDGVPFRDSPIGHAFTESTLRDANGLYRWCPTALVFGLWDSTGSVGGLGTKFARALSAEIVGYGAQAGVHTSSRIDPLGTRSIDVYVTADGSWTLAASEAKQSKSGPVTAKPSEFNHSNIPPTLDLADSDLPTAKKGTPLRGGVSLDRAELCAVLSLPGLRKLRFPQEDGRPDGARNAAARTVLAALALAALALQREQGFDLRSRCLLIPQGAAAYELIAADGSNTPFTLTADAACALLAAACRAAERCGLEWPGAPVRLQPQSKLLELVRRSRAATGTED